MNPRSPQELPFAWLSKPDLRHIANACDNRTDRAAVLAVYLSLAWIASDETSDTFSAKKADIAARAGVSYRKVADVLAFLQRLGVITVSKNVIDGTKELGPNTYTLGTVCTTLGTECLTSGTECTRLGTDAKQGSLPRVEKNLQKNIRRKGPPSAASPIPPAPDGWAAWLAARYPAFAPGGEHHGKAWHEIDDAVRRLVIREMRTQPDANTGEAA